MSERNSGPSLGDVVAGAGLAVGLILAWLYVAGWTYAYHYFDHFRIPLLLVDLPREHLFVYGGLTLWKNLVWAAGFALAAVVLVTAGVLARRRLGPIGLTAFTVVCAVVLFALARPAGTRTAAGLRWARGVLGRMTVVETELDSSPRTLRTEARANSSEAAAALDGASGFRTTGTCGRA